MHSQTLLDILSERASRDADRVAFSHPEKGDANRLTYGQLWSSSQAVAAAVRARTAPGDRVLLVFPAGLDFIPAFIGMLASGRIAVPGCPPDPSRPERTTQRLTAIMRDAEPALILTHPSLDALVRPLVSAPVLTTTDLTDGEAGPTRPAAYAYLQYTSGSTSTPRGVMITHDHLLANCRFAHEHCGFSSESLLVSWVPQYHDQGLVYGVCQPIYDGFPCVLISPQTFIERPHRWLEAISSHRATHAGGPNFTYDVAVRKVPASRRVDLDLSSWMCAYVAGEPVRAATLDAFADAFASCGFRRAAFQPSYGLAEATLRVAASQSGHAPHVLHIATDDLARGGVRRTDPHDAAAVAVVGHGPSEREHRRIIVVDPESRAVLGDDQIGEVWVAGPDVAAGYWHRPDESRAVFEARTADGAGPFLRTGDLGFVSLGELYITGRLKDLIIIRGVNHYPQDIELTVEETLPLVRPGCVAAFSIDEQGEEHVVVAAEIRPPSFVGGETALPLSHPGWNLDRMRAILRRRLAERHDVILRDLVVLAPSTIPKTSSGKVQRSETKRRYLADALIRAHDAHGFVLGQRYRLRDDLIPMRRAGRGGAPITAAPSSDPDREFYVAMHQFGDPKTPVEIAAVLSRTPEAFEDFLRRLRGYIENETLVPVPHDSIAPEGVARLGVTRWHRPHSSRLFFAYTGRKARLMMKPIDFLTRTDLINHTIVMFRDLLKDDYMSGVSIEIPTIEALLTYQRGIIDTSPGVTSAYSVGTSMGAFAAVLAGHELGLEAAWAFGLPGVRYTSKYRTGMTWDLRERLKHWNGVTQYHLYFHSEHARDAQSARELDGLPGVMLHPLPGNRHHVVRSLWERGLLQSVFPAPENRVQSPLPGHAVMTDPEVDILRILEIVRKAVATGSSVEWTPISPLADHLDSFGTIDLLVHLETELGVALELSELQAADLQTPASLTAFVQRQVSRIQ